MLPATSLLIPIQDLSQVGDARRQAVQLVESVEFDDVDAGHVALVVSELATNLAKHAKEGALILRLDQTATDCVLEVLSLDRGPGIIDIEQCLHDGYSTSGSPGTGLGAIRRLSRTWDIYSQPSSGTVQLARLARRATKPSVGKAPQIAGISVPITGETVCGDAWCYSNEGDIQRILVADGLGHGPLAANASTEAVQILQNHPHASPVELLQRGHPALRATRGAAVAVAEIRPSEGTVRFAGVGNIAGFIVSPGTLGLRSMVSMNGTLGCLSPKFRDFTYPVSSGAKVILFSDGLVTQVKLDPYLGLLAHDPAVIAGVLYRDFQRGRDDATVVVASLA